jgi:hypothetical protein
MEENSTSVIITVPSAGSDCGSRESVRGDLQDFQLSCYLGRTEVGTNDTWHLARTFVPEFLILAMPYDVIIFGILMLVPPIPDLR